MYFLQCLKRHTPMLYGIHSIISNKIPDSSSIKIDNTLKKENLLYNLLVMQTKVHDFPINSLNKTHFNQTTLDKESKKLSEQLTYTNNKLNSTTSPIILFIK